MASLRFFALLFSLHVCPYTFCNTSELDLIADDNQINITKKIEEINLINKTQKSKDKISLSELNEDELDSGPIPPWIR